MSNDEDNWNLGTKSGLVNVGEHKLWLSTGGPDRIANEPVVLIVHGLANSSTRWAAVVRLLSPFIRVYCYERAGYGKSELSKDKPTSTNIATDLSQLLQTADVRPPYIIIAHSWGGVLCCEFIHLRSCSDVIGIVFVEANQENTLNIADWRHPALAALQDGIDVAEATGIETSHNLTSDEWRIFRETEATEQHQRQVRLEMEEYPGSFPVLASKRQLHRKPPMLGQHPIYVLRGRNEMTFYALYHEQLRQAKGNKAQKTEVEQILRTWAERNSGLQKELLSLSNVGCYVEAEYSGHDVQLTEPEVIVKGVRWVLAHLENSEI